MVEAIARNETVNQSLDGKEALGVAAQLVSDLANTVNQSLAGKEASGVAAQLVSDLADAVDVALSSKEPAGTAAEVFSQLNLDAIELIKEVNPVDVYIYDTRNDSDYGAWRERSEFDVPQIIVFIVEPLKVTGYDVTKPNAPL